jgi:catechol 2,3-dioxygenase-like lactoylglutathione lyase family enzyme
MGRAARRSGHPSQTLRRVGSASVYKCDWSNQSPESAQAFRSWRSSLVRAPEPVATGARPSSPFWGRARSVPAMPAGALEFNHVMVYTRNLAKSLRFYSGALGFTVLEHQAPFYARLRSPKGRQTIALHLARPRQRLRPEADGVRLYFEVRDLDRLYRRLLQRGVKFTQPPEEMVWGWRHAYLNDPDGHELSLYWAGRKRLSTRPSPTGRPG